MMLAPCEESDSRMVLISRAKGIERAGTSVRLFPGISVQPDTPTFVLAAPPSWDVGLLAHAGVKLLHVILS